MYDSPFIYAAAHFHQYAKDPMLINSDVDMEGANRRVVAAGARDWTAEEIERASDFRRNLADTLRVEATIPKTKGLKPIWSIFLNTPYTNNINRHLAWYKTIMSLKFSNIPYGTYDRSLPNRWCTGCQSYDHILDSCPYPDLPGWKSLTTDGVEAVAEASELEWRILLEDERGSEHEIHENATAEPLSLPLPNLDLPSPPPSYSLVVAPLQKKTRALTENPVNRPTIWNEHPNLRSWSNEERQPRNAGMDSGTRRSMPQQNLLTMQRELLGILYTYSRNEQVPQGRNATPSRVRGSGNADAADTTDDNPGSNGRQTSRSHPESGSEPLPQNGRAQERGIRNTQVSMGVGMPPEVPQQQIMPNGASDSGPKTSKSASRAVLQVATLNMRGGGSATTSRKWNQINQLVRDENIGVLALQETHISTETAAELESQFGRLKIIISPHPTYPTSREGVALVINKYTTQWKETRTWTLIEGKAILVSLKWHHENQVNILAVYAPTGSGTENADFWTMLEEKFKNDQSLPRVDVMLGDCNMVEMELDRSPMH
ncbi:hypothetical protein FA13DRAFT_1714218 [Coprinellus micaceus]|uniref:Endonuclease/exonuclease/phosphatase domain-containing protein n=1 Tax=Coprinellus micaceus TaxID=71717 RepID=A0A4Y7STP6_COPMI|nr:hypothetical protein FA13DRAFT_1714218 [Coprinellus micaceus]